MSTKQANIILQVFVLCLCFIVSLAATQTLVLYDDSSIKTTHSIFFHSLTSRGHELTFRDVYEKNSLHKYGVWQYDNLVIFAPSATDINGISTENVVSFIDSGRNILVAASINVSDPIREIASECGVDFDQAQTQVVDHSSYDNNLDDGDHSVVATDSVHSGGFVDAISAPVLFRGVSHSINEQNRFVTKVLRGSSFSHSARVGSNQLATINAGTALVSAMQTRINARAVFSGSLELFSNKFFLASVNTANGNKAAKSGNEEFAIEISKWAFQERGVLKTSNWNHHKIGSDEVNSLSYRIKDDIEFSLDIFQNKDNKLIPFTDSDVQLEVVMLDPYIRTTLQHDNKGHYSLRFTLPDVYGVYKFRVIYQKAGYSQLELEQTIPLHPFRHNEFERFISCAYPYYGSAFSMMAGFFVFGFVFLYHKEA